MALSLAVYLVIGCILSIYCILIIENLYAQDQGSRYQSSANGRPGMIIRLRTCGSCNSGPSAFRLGDSAIELRRMIVGYA
jgi:hypothetical protein